MNCWPSGKYVHLLCMYSILGRGSFCFNYCLNSPWHEVISLWHCWGGMETQVSLTVAFSSSAFFGLLFLIFLLTIPHRFSMGFRSGEFAGQSSTPTAWSFNQLLVLLAVWAGAKSCWKMKSASLKSWSAEGSMKCTSVCGGSWCLDPSLSPFLVKFTQILESIDSPGPPNTVKLDILEWPFIVASLKGWPQ